ncbi:MAG TPA: ABC transporter ATP-binding protein [bacterium]|nr:ABC transporter ATP-binding protein [bacterium]
MMPEPYVLVRGLAKDYTGGVTVHALTDVSFAIFPGEVVALTGPSGSGKTTLLNLLGGLDVPTAGEVLVGGRSLGDLGDGELSLYRNREVGFVFQTYNLLPHLTALENVAVPLLVRGLSFEEARSRAAELLSDMGLADRGPSLPSQLSGGQAQRVALARALSTEPRLLLGDEVTGNLDRATGREMLDLVRAQVAGRGLTAVVVTHDPSVSDWADRALELQDGHLVA